MRFTQYTVQYFKHTRKRTDRACIKMEWIETTVSDPDAERVQADGRIRKWKKIEEAGNKYLRVVLLKDGTTVHNTFFDRRYKE